MVTWARPRRGPHADQGGHDALPGVDGLASGKEQAVVVVLLMQVIVMRDVVLDVQVGTLAGSPGARSVTDSCGLP